MPPAALRAVPEQIIKTAAQESPVTFEFVEQTESSQAVVIRGRRVAGVDVLNGTAALYKSLGGGWPAVPAEVRDAGLGGNARPVMR